MGGEWKETSLAAVMDVKHGFAFSGKNIRDEPPGDILLTPGNFAIGGGFKGDKFKYFDGDIPDEYVLSDGDLLVTMTDLSKEADTLGYPSLVPASHGPRFLHNQRLGKVVIKPGAQLDKLFLFYLLRTDEYRHEVLASATGTTVKHTSPVRILAHKTTIPPLIEQQAIACILGVLDDKIELNRRMNKTLEEMARAIFKSWFVDFLPVRAKAAGQQPLGLKPEIAALFPDSFEDSELGEIPKGWSIGTVEDIVDLLRDSLLPGDYVDEVFDHYSIPAYDAGQNPVPETGSAIKSQKFIVTDDCVLVSKLNPKTPRVWIPATDKSHRRIASTEFLVCRPKASRGLGRWYIYGLACDSTFSDYLTSRASGTSNSHQRVRPQDFLSYEIPFPASKLAMAFNDKVEPILTRVFVLKNESRTLAALRDTLLPKLISGELRVKDAERIAGRCL